MKNYLVERHFGHVTPEQLQVGGSTSKRVATEQFPDSLTWCTSHATQTDDGLVTYCHYQATDEATIRAHAEQAGLPCDKIMEVDLVGPGDFA
jgi:hypothetical protein